MKHLIPNECMEKPARWASSCKKTCSELQTSFKGLFFVQTEDFLKSSKLQFMKIGSTCWCKARGPGANWEESKE